MSTDCVIGTLDVNLSGWSGVVSVKSFAQPPRNNGQYLFWRRRYNGLCRSLDQRYSMTFLTILCTAAMVMSFKAAPCSNNQHCSDCDDTTDHCLTDCDIGYYDLKCSTRCSRKCKKKRCKLSVNGIGVCTEGCAMGYYGKTCDIPCDSPGGNCTACPDGCDGGYCQLGSSCVSGCVDSYYGTDCKTCSSRCKSCNRITGTCDECQLQYFGKDCEYSCRNCIKQCRYGCRDGCLQGYYGIVCTETCNENCRGANPKVNQAMGIQALTSVRNECHQQNGDCTHGCKDGWHGRQCSFPCSSKCQNRRCNVSGDCEDGCAPGYFSTHCEPCPVNCANNSCNSYQGHCQSGCMDGFYGEMCDRTCDVCLDGACDQMTGTCIRGCNVTKRRCTTPVSCTNNCSINWCMVDSCADTLEIRDMKIGLSVALTTLLIGILLAVFLFLFCRKRLSPNREPQGHATGQVVAYSTGYSTLHRYWEIRDEDVNMHCEPPVLNEEEPEQDADMDMPVQVEVLHNDLALSTPSRSPTPSLSSHEDPESYSHLERDDNDPVAAESYITPVEDIPETRFKDLA
ncbi:multiple epidermal growth factor-like domains protein 10 [Haliotis rufescens]|uniref:multiple epidermal growth factor-like domains protein 10 n=1 Tax=Haliotis rufescens TaxID=6454 RepID=UPI001EB05377|nr:multiple epidermal growth factor-like domains protein 10 [Haliotis rufescens]XP_048251458.1 multiple epidermal growth factor-like domains protein 10 [Haliotis rufescens]